MVVSVLCSRVRDLLFRYGFEITYSSEDEYRCVFNFRDSVSYRRMRKKYEPEVLEYLQSSIIVDKEKRSINANMVSPLDRFCELFLSYCCTEGGNRCRIHIDPEYTRIGLEVKNLKLKELGEALTDFINCIR